MVEYLFVYGLLCDSTRSSLSEEIAELPIRKVGQATCRGALYLIAEYPGIKLNSSKTTVHGELYKITNKPFIWKCLDRFELSRPLFTSGRHEYTRQKVIIKFANRLLSAWVYQYDLPVSALKKIKSGKYQPNNSLLNGKHQKQKNKVLNE